MARSVQESKVVNGKNKSNGVRWCIIAAFATAAINVKST